MVCYNLKRKLIYIHIPKTGGLTIENILVKRYGFKYFNFKDGRYEFLNNPMGKLGIFKYILAYSEEAKKYDLKSFKKIAFVRHPYDRAISAMKFLHRISTDFPPTMEEFVLYCRINTYYYVHFNLSQTDCLKDDNDELHVDYLGRFEHFERDLRRILFEELNFPVTDISKIHKNKSNSTLDIESYDLFKEVDKVNSEDFANFNYRMLN